MHVTHYVLYITLKYIALPGGQHPRVYIDLLARQLLDPTPPPVPPAKQPHLLVAFYPKSRIPDRAKVLDVLGAYLHLNESKWYNFTDLDHAGWLEGITLHRFVLAPFGHGLDTHRVSEILLMGGVPVMRRSSISSCYDDSDNTIGRHTRGSLPVVILDSWSELTEQRLEAEWTRIERVPREAWDWRRGLLDQWVDRVHASYEGYARLPICIGVLSFRDDIALRRTLQSYVSAGLFDITEQSIIFFQAASTPDRKKHVDEVLKEFPMFNVSIVETSNIVFEAFVRIAEACTAKYILLLGTTISRTIVVIISIMSVSRTSYRV